MKPGCIILNTLVHKPVVEVWEKWITSQHIECWNAPNVSWLCTVVENNFKEGGLFRYKLENKNTSEYFEHISIYKAIDLFKSIIYLLNDNRQVVTEFQQIDENTIVRESIEPDAQIPRTTQEAFCNTVLKRFKEYAEQESRIN